MSVFRIVKLTDPIQFSTINGGLVPRGAYNAATDYAVGDSVDYLGSSYVMFNDAAAGTVPTNTTYWQVLANKGTTGADGAPGGTFTLPTFDAGKYLTNDGASLSWGTPAGGNPGGSNTFVQYNASAAFGGDPDFTYNPTTNVLSVDTLNLSKLNTRTVLVDKNATAVTGKIYTSVPLAANYTYSQTPTASSTWAVMVKPGTYTNGLHLVYSYTSLSAEGGLGTVEIRDTDDDEWVGNMQDNSYYEGLTIRKTSGEGGGAIDLPCSNIYINNCKGIVDSAVTEVSNTPDALDSPSGYPTGTIRNSYFEAPGLCAELGCGGTLDIWDTEFYSYRTSGSTAAIGYQHSGDGGTVNFHHCQFKVSVTGNNEVDGLVIKSVTAANTLEMHLYDCEFDLTGSGNGTINIIKVGNINTGTINLYLHNCTYTAASGTSGAINAVNCGTSTATVKVIGGFTNLFSGGTIYDLKQTAGTLTNIGLNSGGRYSGTITHDGEIGSESFKSSTTVGILESGTSPTYYTYMQSADLSADKTFTWPSSYPTSANLPMIGTASGTGALGWGNQALQTTNTPQFAGLTLTGTENTRLLTPTAHNTYDLGEFDMCYQDLYIAGTIYDATTGDTTVAKMETAYTHSQDNTQAHSDYLLNNGADSTSGALTSPNFISNVAIGTQPFACTSTTVNTNLNAGLLNGKADSDFLLAAGTDNIKDTHIDWGTGAGQVSAVDVPMADAGAYYDTDDIESSLQQIGTGAMNTRQIINWGGSGYQAAAAYLNIHGAGAGRHMMIRAGSITGIAAYINSGASYVINYQIWKNGSAFAGANQIVTANGAGGTYTTFPTGSYTFVTGDLLQAQVASVTASPSGHVLDLEILTNV